MDLLLFCTLVLHFFTLVSSSSSSDADCGLYLSESSTGHTLGNFAGRSYESDETIGSSDAIIQIVDIRHHNMESGGTDQEGRAFVDRFLVALWSGDATGGSDEGDDVVSAVGGPVFSSTGHVGMTNAVIYHPSTLLRTDTDLLAAGYDEFTSPGRGAFTTYHNLTLLAVDKIPVGMEIFLDFGAEYNAYENPDAPTDDDYRKMDEAIKKMVEYFDKHAENLGEKAAEEVFEFIKNDVLNLTAETRAPAARSLLPDTYQGLQAIIDVGGTALYKNPSVRRDLDWLKMNGYCQDNLIAGVSNIPHAGRGAFAKRSMKRGEVVSVMPLMALNNGIDALVITDEEEYGDDTTYQLLLNYMLQHPQSSTLFFPAGAMTNYINHGSKKSNVKMIWSTKSWSDVRSAQEVQLEDVSLIPPIDLILELVATRPIKKGEEVLLDYGDKWDTAWKDHVNKWKAGKDTNILKSAMTLNEEHHSVRKPPKPFSTDSENQFAVDNLHLDDKKNVALKCQLLYDEDKIERRRNADGTRTKIYPWIPYPVAGESRLKSDSAIRGINRVDCTIIDRSGDETSGYKYLVSGNFKYTDTGAIKMIIIKNVPHYAIRYVDKPYTNPQYELSAFRHAIQFPDDIFPNRWRNLVHQDGDHNEL